MSSRTTASFPVVHATPAPHALLSEILPRYDIEATACRLHATGVNDVYAITARTGAYFLKVYRAGWRTEPTVRYELDLLRHLRERGVAVASPVPLRDGEMLLILDAPEGRRAAVLYVRARGRPFTHPFCRSASEAAAAGSALASMHTATDAFSSAYPRLRMDLTFLLDRPMMDMQPFFAHRADDWNYLTGLANRLRRRMDELARGGLAWGVCHGDYHAGNAFLAVDGSVTPFDFDACAESWRVYDWTRYYRDSRGTPEGQVVWVAFLRAYRERRPVRDVDLAALPPLVDLHIIFVLWLRLHGVAQAWWDSWWLETDIFDRSLAELRVLDAGHLGA